ncbi:MAG: hypothetical protein HY512_01265 [Candidatus Aenigmarchaeota archaeon]|nr:hypothetical protein [Candidatus Aenigmarchaeota archaeon]
MNHYAELKDHVGRQVMLSHRDESGYRNSVLAEIDQRRETYTFVWWAGNTDARNMIGFVNVPENECLSVKPGTVPYVVYVLAGGRGELCPSVPSPLFKVPEDMRRKEREKFEKFKAVLEAQDL